MRLGSLLAGGLAMIFNKASPTGHFSPNRFAHHMSSSDTPLDEVGASEEDSVMKEANAGGL